jgi:hypothetical protein
VDFSYATLTGTDFHGADTRGANFYYGLDTVPPGAIISNLIREDGRIDGLDLDADGMLIIRDYDGDSRRLLPPVPITIDQHMAMAPGGTLRMVFETDAWDSTISFAPGIPVTLGGTLALTFAADVNPASQIGRTFDLFDWTGVTPTGTFAVSSQYAWKLSNLYTTGKVTLTAVPEPACLAFSAIALVVIVSRRGRRFTALTNQRPYRLRIIVALTLVVALQQSSSHAAALRTVALSGQEAPGTPVGVTYSSFGAHFLFTIPDEVLSRAGDQRCRPSRVSC